VPSAAVGSGGVPQRWRWFHLEVHNIGSKRAKVCKGYIEALYHPVGDGFEKHPDWVNRLPLVWANTGGKAELGIDSQMKNRLDFFRTSGGVSGNRVLEFVAGAPSIGLPTSFALPGRWRALVAVESDNTRTARALFELDLTGTLDDIAVRKLPTELVP
jgi:hypothetical protein